MDKFSSVKRILLITGIYPPDIGGPATYIPQLASFLKAVGWEVKVLTLSNNDTKDVSFSGQVTRVRRSLPLPIRVPLTILKGWWVGRSANVILVNGLYEEGALISLLTRAPLVAKVVGNPVWEKINSANPSSQPSEAQFIKFSSKPLKFGSRMRAKIWVWSLQRARVIYVPGQILKEHLRNFGLIGEIELISNGVPVLDSTKVCKEVDVVAVSRLVPWKNIDILIESAVRYGFSLEIIGEGPQEESLKAQASMRANIKFLGRLSPEKVHSRLKRARIFALLSNYEGMSFSLIEALAAGTPCVVSDIRSNLDVIASGGGVKVPLRDAESTGKVLSGLLGDEIRLASLGNAALKNVDANFGLKQTLEKAERLLIRYAR